jgi:plastocyanin
MKRRDLLSTAGALATPLVAGCSGNGVVPGGDEDTTTTTAEADETVELSGNSFDPQILKVDEGDTVEWENAESVEHTVTSTTFSAKGEEWEFDETLSSEGDTARFTFENEGIHEYYCTVHGEETMCGVVLVGSVFSMVGYEPTLPCAEETTESDDGS